jgi:hypothetical protein
VSTRAVPASGTGGTSTVCGSDTAIGGGLALLKLQLVNSGSGLFSGTMRDDGALVGSFKLAAICDDDPPEIDFVEAQFSATAPTVSGASVICPIGTRAINGGVDILGFADELSTALLSPGFLFDGMGTRLYERPDGRDLVVTGRGYDSVQAYIEARVEGRDATVTLEGPLVPEAGTAPPGGQDAGLR